MITATATAAEWPAVAEDVRASLESIELLKPLQRAARAIRGSDRRAGAVTRFLHAV